MNGERTKKTLSQCTPQTMEEENIILKRTITFFGEFDSLNLRGVYLLDLLFDFFWEGWRVVWISWALGIFFCVGVVIWFLKELGEKFRKSGKCLKQYPMLSLIQNVDMRQVNPQPNVKLHDEFGITFLCFTSSNSTPTSCCVSTEKQFMSSSRKLTQQFET